MSQPRIFSLQKLVEVADFNMDSRGRIVWANVWGVLGEHFSALGAHSNRSVRPLTLARWSRNLFYVAQTSGRNMNVLNEQHESLRCMMAKHALEMLRGVRFSFIKIWSC